MNKPVYGKSVLEKVLSDTRRLRLLEEASSRYASSRSVAVERKEETIRPYAQW